MIKSLLKLYLRINRVLPLQEFGTASMGLTASGYNNIHFQISANGSLKQLKLYNENTEKIDISRFYIISKAPV